MDALGVSVDVGTRAALHRIAAHVLGRRRWEVSGRFGLRATPGGFGTPAFGNGPEVVRLSGLSLVHETGGESEQMAIAGSTLRQLASFVGADIERAFSCGEDTPAVGDTDAPVDVDGGTATVLAGWYWLGWEVLDSVLGQARGDTSATIQLWPEHFDAGTTVGLPTGEKVNLGFSPGDSFEAEPYAYVGPSGDERPGDPDFWNAPFGAVLRASDVTGATDPAQRCRDFLAAGLRNARGG